jgi:hypothetical protein
MQLLAVLFKDVDPTKGNYDQLPLAVIEIDRPEDLPNDGQVWVLMTHPALNDYIFRVRAKTEPITEYVDAYDAAHAKVQAAKQFGLSLIDQAAAENIAMGLNTMQVMAVLQKFSSVIPMLSTGSLSSALVVLQQLKGDSLVPQSRIDYYIQKIKNFIGAQQ